MSAEDDIRVRAAGTRSIDGLALSVANWLAEVLACDVLCTYVSQAPSSETATPSQPSSPPSRNSRLDRVGRSARRTRTTANPPKPAPSDADGG